MPFDFSLIKTPIPLDSVNRILDSAQIPSLAHASIRRLASLIGQIENDSGEQFIRMELGVPGINTPKIGIDAEIEALKSGVSSIYPPLDGVPALKKEISRFCKLFLDVEVHPSYCYPTVGSGQGAMAAFLVANRIRQDGATLFIDPGFPNQKIQVTALGQTWDSFDIYEHRGEALRDILEEKLSTGIFTTLLYSNPNNPSWICFNEQELQIIAEVAANYDVIVIEDLAYIGMDYRNDYSVPGVAPFQPSIGKYAKDYILMISGSKVFSYAGQRIASLVVSDHLSERCFEPLKPVLGFEQFNQAMVFGAFASLSSGVTHSTQYGFTALLKATNDGTIPFLLDTKVYENRAKIMKKMFTDNGFYIVYDKDIDQNIADGFYFTFAYPGLSSGELMEALLYFGISAISLMNTGSIRSDGLRACVSKVHESDLQTLENRLKLFNKTMPINH
jgi:aspartate/methionine/tyrosine aminotransferase